MGVGVQRHTLATLPPEMIRYPLYRRLGEPQGLSEQAQKIPSPLGFDPRTIRSVVSHCFARITLSKLLHSITGNLIEKLFFNFDFQEQCMSDD